MLGLGVAVSTGGLDTAQAVNIAEWIKRMRQRITAPMYPLGQKTQTWSRFRKMRVPIQTPIRNNADSATATDYQKVSCVVKWWRVPMNYKTNTSTHPNVTHTFEIPCWRCFGGFCHVNVWKAWSAKRSKRCLLLNPKYKYYRNIYKYTIYKYNILNINTWDVYLM